MLNNYRLTVKSILFEKVSIKFNLAEQRVFC
jgi:hypothetical protein